MYGRQPGSDCMAMTGYHRLYLMAMIGNALWQL
uniref:Uncharacterized protein n=1 Tax=Picea glauca TaxID=3330 RepID=A0A101LVJ5_PICGL|nr:hypothetical protein ABT39_MTgene1931 [Picea glauca]